MAGRIFDRLVQHFAKTNLFIDIDNVLFGVDFRKHIDDAASRRSPDRHRRRKVARTTSRRKAPHHERGRSGAGRARDCAQARHRRVPPAARRNVDAGSVRPSPIATPSRSSPGATSTSTRPMRGGKMIRWCGCERAHTSILWNSSCGSMLRTRRCRWRSRGYEASAPPAAMAASITASASGEAQSAGPTSRAISLPLRSMTRVVGMPTVFRVENSLPVGSV